MRVIFWDVDGVMNNGPEMRITPIWSEVLSDKDRLYDRMVSPSNFKPVMDLLLYCYEKDIKMVISSSWRILNNTNHIDSLRLNFGYYLIDKLYIGDTPEINGHGRGDEIRTFLFNNPEITDYIVIDDDYDKDFKGLKVFTTTFKYGLTDRHVKNIINYFNKER